MRKPRRTAPPLPRPVPDDQLRRVLGGQDGLSKPQSAGDGIEATHLG